MFHGILDGEGSRCAWFFRFNMQSFNLLSRIRLQVILTKWNCSCLSLENFLNRQYTVNSMYSEFMDGVFEKISPQIAKKMRLNYVHPVLEFMKDIYILKREENRIPQNEAMENAIAEQNKRRHFS